jgi:hypothetical protein
MTTSLGNSDWLSIVLFVISAFIGTCISWIFFRSQQQIDFNRLRESLDSIRANEFKELNASIAVFRQAKDFQEQMRIKDEINGLKGMVQRLSGEMNGLPNKIVITLKAEQKDLLERISEKFNQKVTESQTVVEQSVRKELSGLIPLAQQQQILDRLADMVKYSLMTMGKYQMAIVESESEQVFDEAATKVKTAVVPVTKNIDALQNKVNAISKNRE